MPTKTKVDLTDAEKIRLNDTLCIAASYGNLKDIISTFEKGADLDAQLDGRTSLMRAAIGWSRKSVGEDAYEEIAKFLIDNSAKRNLRINGFAALDYAMISNFKKVENTLRKYKLEDTKNLGLLRPALSIQFE